jgi:hypothetical protein
MSPKEKHIPDHAQRTSVCLTAEDRGAIRWISEVRRAQRNKRATTNDILVDALWYFLEKTEGKTRDQIRSTIPRPPVVEDVGNKIAEMPKRRRKR